MAPTFGQVLYDRVGRMPGAKALGVSVEGRPIWGLAFGGGGALAQPAHAPRSSSEPLPTGPLPTLAMVMVGGIHGDEPASTEALLDLAARLDCPPGDDEEGGAGIPGLWIIPVLNPDGLVQARKNNSHDVDLNRNFPARSFTRSHAPGYDPGPAPLSEPESRVLAELVERERVGGVVAVHAPFACVNFDGPAAAWAEAVSAASGWPVWQDIGYPTPGSLGTWLGVDSRMPVLTLELPPGTLSAFQAAAAAALTAAIDAAPRVRGPA